MGRKPKGRGKGARETKLQRAGESRKLWALEVIEVTVIINGSCKGNTANTTMSTAS